jgi:geranylgeranyl diphosphate synthase type I
VALAVVLGDHLVARALEGMLEAGLPRGAEATRYLLAICRQTAVGQFLDLKLTRAPLAEVTLLQTLRVALLKTARYGFAGPLVAGALLGGGERGLREALEKVGRGGGLAYQLRDDLIGLFGDDAASGKSGAGDYLEGKRTFPVVYAYAHADAAGKAELAALWELSDKGPADLALARAAVERHGGRAATERLISRFTQSARRALTQLPEAGGLRGRLDGLLLTLSKREA